MQGTAIDLKIILQALSQIMHIPEVMSNLSNTMKKRERLQSKWTAAEKTYNQDVPEWTPSGYGSRVGQREPSTRRLGTGA